MRKIGLTNIGIAALMALALEGCVSAPPMDYAAMPREHGRSNLIDQGDGTRIQCVPFARDESGILIYGDAVTWWDQASGRYARDTTPSLGSVMVLHNYAGAGHGHLAVVRNVVNSREIRVDHANWLNDGSVFLNDPVVDVSADNDWSAVRVWNIPNNAWGGRVYPVQGFIAQSGNAPSKARGGGMGPVAFAGK